MYSDIGRLTVIDGQRFIQTQAGQKGYVLYGPYVPMSPGDYKVDFWVSSGRRTNDNVCVLDVLAGGETKIAEQKSTGRQLSKMSLVQITFSLQQRENIEFRVFSNGLDDLLVKVDRPVTLVAPRADNLHETIQARSTFPAFFQTHAGAFEEFEGKGFSFRHVDNRIIAAYDNVQFEVCNVEDFQIMTEVFLINEYNFRIFRPCTVIDIGMNIGLTSLYMANKSNVIKVYGFEPFSHPFQRAIFNIELNKNLKDKIYSQKCGLSDFDNQIDVNASTDTSIGTSIKGLVDGTAESIEIRDASALLVPVFDEAARLGHEIVLKIDCEGSEFGIMRSLIKAGLIQKVSCILCEWHKWWSEETQDAMLVPLTEAGFLVLDRTNPINRYTGFFYAVNRYDRS